MKRAGKQRVPVAAEKGELDCEHAPHEEENVVAVDAVVVAKNREAVLARWTVIAASCARVATRGKQRNQRKQADHPIQPERCREKQTRKDCACRAPREEGYSLEESKKENEHGQKQEGKSKKASKKKQEKRDHPVLTEEKRRSRWGREQKSETQIQMGKEVAR